MQSQTVLDQAMMQVAQEYLEKGELQKAAEEFQRAAKGAEQSPVGSTETQISCLLNAGACLVSLGEYEKGLSCLRSAAAIITARSPSTGPAEDEDSSSPTRPPENQDGSGPTHNREDDKDVESLQLLADVHYNSAIAHQALGDHDQAAQEFQSCLNIHEKSGNLQISADVLTALADCHHQTGQFDQEFSYLEKAQAVCKELGESGREAMMCVRLARARFRAGREGECRQMLSTAKMVGSRVVDKKLLGSLYSECGWVHSSLGQHDEALRCFEQALPLVRGAGESENQLQEASLLQNIGATYNKKQMYSESLAYHREAATMHGRLESQEVEIKCLCNLAFAQSQLGDYTSASATLTKAEERAHATKNTDLQFQTCETLGGLYYHMSQFPEAERAFNSALELLDKTGGDTETARERVMKKLSDVKEASQKGSRANPSTDTQKSPSHSSSVTPPFNESMEDAAQDNRVSSAGGEERMEEGSTAAVRSDTPQSQDSHERELQAYQEALNSSHGSSEETSHHLCNSSQRSGLEQSSLFQGQDGINPPLRVTEGSLAIGANAREMYTVQQSRTEAGRKGNRRKTGCTTEIVRRDREDGRQGEPEGPAGDNNTNGLPQPPPSSDHTVHSRTCAIL
jgi:tetratricopeptide (TPR) repeat protein